MPYTRKKKPSYIYIIAAAPSSFKQILAIEIEYGDGNVFDNFRRLSINGFIRKYRKISYYLITKERYKKANVKKVSAKWAIFFILENSIPDVGKKPKIYKSLQGVVTHCELCQRIGKKRVTSLPYREKI